MTKITDEKFIEIQKQFTNRLRAASYKIVKDNHASEDVIQNVFYKLYKQDYSKIEDHLTEWLFAVCRNFSIKTLHKRNRYVFIDNIDELDSIDESPCVSETMMQAELIKVMSKLVKKLTKNQQKALKLKYFKDHSYAEIAKKLKTTTGNVGFMLSTGISKLKNLLDKENSKRGYY
jgi:RNA polymerase sigma-70 factor (ECF subfamily)